MAIYLTLVFIASCQKYVEWIFSTCLHLPNHYIKVYNINDDHYTAYTFNTNYQMFLHNAQGVIYLNSDYFARKRFTPQEIEFVLAHESIHIFKNHTLNSKFWTTIETTLKGKDPFRYLAVEGFKLLSALISEKRISIDAESLRNDEYQADELAVKFITHTVPIAINCLRRLSDFNLNNASHFWKLFDVKIPMMTFSQRIDELLRRTSI